MKPEQVSLAFPIVKIDWKMVKNFDASYEFQNFMSETEKHVQENVC